MFDECQHLSCHRADCQVIKPIATDSHVCMLPPVLRQCKTGHLLEDIMQKKSNLALQRVTVLLGSLEDLRFESKDAVF